MKFPTDILPCTMSYHYLDGSQTTGHDVRWKQPAGSLSECFAPKGADPSSVYFLQLAVNSRLLIVI